jgi:hypothetical protein
VGLNPGELRAAQRAFLEKARKIAPVALDRAEPLYRFLRYASPVERQGVHDALINRHFRFGRPCDFNDPFDCRPHLYVPGLLAMSRRRWFTRETMKIVRQDYPNDPTAEQNALAELARYTMEAQVEDAEIRVRNTLLTTQRMLCLCGNRERALMWAYYADRHRGVAIHLSPHVWPIAAAMRVSYTDRYPALPLSDRGDKRKITRAFALTKAKAWRHEAEYRVLVQDEDPQRFAVDWIDQDTARLPATSVTGVTVGSLMDDAAVKQLVASAQAATPPLAVYRAITQRKRFKLEIKRIA